MLVVRKASLDEADIILEMYNRIIDDTDGKVPSPKWTKGVYPDYNCVFEAIKKGEMYVALSDGIVAGALIRNHKMAPGYDEIEWDVKAPDEEIFVIHTMGVSPDFQHKGIASKLAEAVAEEGRRSGIKAIRLDVIDENYPPMKLFEKCGYKNHGQHILRYYGMTNTSFTLMELKLCVN
ncbi:MAG: GNAT family N-acetyltransferase [Spirochaetes bacterium]|uniref:GNAT family N-acetyltransferase n=1 Tax=Candidatus Ornithospirochaeta stercoripullorum TaxID=2840899 RepID=A0A9D9H531_9SPIO|nr:GNAT family N-acetyltransferase [Candidatus Ornithospirochaeta stercoripullorum]